MDILEPDYPDLDYVDVVKPTFNKNSVVLSRDGDCDFLALDQSHFFYSNDDLIKHLHYIVANCEFSSIGFLDCPFVDPVKFEPKFVISTLSEHCNILHDVIKTNCPHATVCSPVICYLNKEESNHYVDFFVKSRNFFDVYAFAAYHDFTDPVIAQLNTLLTNILNVLRKEVWVTHFAIPSVRNKLQGFMTYNQAATKLKDYFLTMNALTNNKIKWFLPAIGRDGSITRNPGESIYYFYEHIRPYIGLLDDKGNKKEQIIEAFLSLHS